jgi:hypothetical protein
MQRHLITLMARDSSAVTQKTRAVDFSTVDTWSGKRPRTRRFQQFDVFIGR